MGTTGPQFLDPPGFECSPISSTNVVNFTTSLLVRAGSLQAEPWYQAPTWPEEEGAQTKMMHFEVGVVIEHGFGLKAVPSAPRRCGFHSTTESQAGLTRSRRAAGAGPC